MIYFMDALNLDSQNREQHFTTKIPDNYQEHYFKSLENGEGFNPMDALEKTFKSEGLDKKTRSCSKKLLSTEKSLNKKKSRLPLF